MGAGWQERGDGAIRLMRPVVLAGMGRGAAGPRGQPVGGRPAGRRVPARMGYGLEGVPAPAAAAGSRSVDDGASLGRKGEPEEGRPAAHGDRRRDGTDGRADGR